jgi:hypothetical protein
MSNTYHHNSDKKAILAKMKDDWEIDTQLKQIKLKRRSIFRRLLDLLSFKRYTVRELYTFIYNEFHSKENIKKMMVHDFPIDHDNIKKPEGVPFIYVMQAGWIIPKNSLRKVGGGPLISEDGSKVLVSANSKLDALVRFIIELVT